MKNIRFNVPFLLILAGLILTGCKNLNPVVDSVRYYTLAPVALPVEDSLAPRGSVAVGVGQVEIPEYLQPRQLAFRKGDNEIHYSEMSRWAERLDKGIQRVLAADMAALLGATNVASSAWRRGEVQAEIYVSVQRCEVLNQGDVLLEARWRIMSPGAEQTLRTGTARIVRKASGTPTDPSRSVAAMSEALGRLSQDITQALREVR